MREMVGASYLCAKGNGGFSADGNLGACSLASLSCNMESLKWSARGSSSAMW